MHGNNFFKLKLSISQQVPHMVQTLAALFAKSQTSLNAAVYVLSHPKFRKQMGYIATSNLPSDQQNAGLFLIM